MPLRITLPESNQSGFGSAPVLSALAKPILLELKMIGQGAGVGEVDAQRIRHFAALTRRRVQRQRRPVTHPTPSEYMNALDSPGFFLQSVWFALFYVINPPLYQKIFL